MKGKLGPVVEGYRTKLLELQKELTRENKLEEAVAVKGVLDGVEAVTPEPGPAKAVGGLSSPVANGDLFVNSLGMKFAPVRIHGESARKKRVLFSIWETRVKDYQAFVQATGRKSPRKPGFQQSDDHPVVLISALDAMEFCKWLTKKEKTESVIGLKDQYRLPSDHEWSCAVGIGSQEDPDEPLSAKRGNIKNVYPWGEDWPPPEGVGNYLGEETTGTPWGKNGTIVDFNDGFQNTAPVGTFTPNPLGLFDMGGNVFEWCGDWYDPEKKERQIFRGGAWRQAASSALRSSMRGWGPPYDTIGFRCVLEIAEEN